MKQTTLSHIDSPLLKFAISKLDPEIFSHPVWPRFGKQDRSDSRGVINNLLSEAKNLQDKDPSVACQVLLMCAVYQNYTGQHYYALRTNQQAVSLAERMGLVPELIWARWVACAISIQQGNYDQATSLLVDLRAVLNKQNEWVLAGYVDMFTQFLSQPVTMHSSNHPNVAHDQAWLDFTLIPALRGNMIGETVYQQGSSSQVITRSINRIHLLEWKLLFGNTGQSLSNVSPDKPFDVSLTLELNVVALSEGSYLESNGTLYAKKLSGGLRQMLSEMHDVVPYTKIINLTICNTRLWEGYLLSFGSSSDIKAPRNGSKTPARRNCLFGSWSLTSSLSIIIP